MALVLTEDQELLAQTARDFIRTHSPVSRLRVLRDAQDSVGFSQDVWQEMAQLGWAGILIPEGYGGAGLGLADLAVVLEAVGRNLAPEPFLSTVLLSGQLLAHAGSPEQKQAWLPGIATVKRFLRLPIRRRAAAMTCIGFPHRPQPKGTPGGCRAKKIQVLDGQNADALIVSARTSGEDSDQNGITLFLIAPDTPGVALIPQTRVDNRAAALVTLDGVKIGAESVVGTVSHGFRTLSHIVDLATVGLCAEMLGGMSQIFDDTLAYLKTREQFGVVIGSFQALKHRAAKVFMEIELCRSAVLAAANAADAGESDLALLVSLAKARCSAAFILATPKGSKCTAASV